MGDNVSLWGTFSVVDHLRHRPFVSDVLLYDRLVVPVPAGDEELVRWRGLGRNPDLQAELLGIVGRDLSVPVPWTLALHDEWAKRYGVPSDPQVEAAVRDGVADAVRWDATDVEMARRASAANAVPAGAGDPDDPGYMITRRVLADEIGSDRDRSLVARLPRIDEVEAVVAYGSYSDFAKERGVLEHEVLPGTEPFFTFRWSFFVPANSELNDQELLGKAVELAHADEISAWRAAVQRWRRDSVIAGQSDAEALKEMEAMIAEYAEAARKLKIKVAVRHGCLCRCSGGRRRRVCLPARRRRVAVRPRVAEAAKANPKPA